MPRTRTLTSNAPAPAQGHTHVTFALFGAGMVHDAVAEALAEHGNVNRISETNLAQLAIHWTMLVVATDSWDTSRYPQIRRACADRGISWLPVRVELGTVVIGPIERSGVPGCVQCTERRRQRARENSDGHRAVWQRHGAVLAQRPSSWLTSLGSDTVGALVADEVSRLVNVHHTARTRCAIVYLDLEQLTVTRHSFLPDPLCPECGELPDDAPDLAEITLISRPKPAADTHRVRPVVKELDRLIDTYVDAETGMIRTLNRDTQGGLVVTAALMTLRSGNRLVPGYGRTRSYRTSELIAVLEALERYGGVEPGGKRIVVEASYADIADHALDPRTCGVHPPESYELPGFPYQPFDENHVCRWTWAYSFANRAPILVPEACAYYDVPSTTPDDRPFFYEISNGCALGSCLEEAILHGLLEVAERDAFLLTWYARMPVPRIDLRSAHDPTIPLQAAAITAETGYQILAFDTTMEQRIPCVWAMAVNVDGTATRPKTISAAGSHLTLERATLNALSELGPILWDFTRHFPSEADRARQMAADSSLVMTMHDHSTLYGEPQVFDRLDFLTSSTGLRSLSLPAPDQDAFRNADLRDDLLSMLHCFLNSGMDVIVIDQTTPEHQTGGFACVKVLAPGTVPMTFGHHNRRVDRLPRLYQVPHLLGYQPQPLRHDDLNSHPHPFP